MQRYDREIAPVKKYRIIMVDEHGQYVYSMKRPLSSKPIYYDSMEDAKESVEYYKKKEPWHFKDGNKIKIIEASFDDEVAPGYYQKPHGGRRYKFTPEERKRIREEQEESDSYGPPYKWFPPLPDEEIEPRSQEEIFRMGGIKALKEYEEGIRDRKKKRAAAKPKRKTTKTAKPAKRCHKPSTKKVVRKTRK